MSVNSECSTTVCHCRTVTVWPDSNSATGNTNQGLRYALCCFTQIKIVLGCGHHCKCSLLRSLPGVTTAPPTIDPKCALRASFIARVCRNEEEQGVPARDPRHEWRCNRCRSLGGALNLQGLQTRSPRASVSARPRQQCLPPFARGDPAAQEGGTFANAQGEMRTPPPLGRWGDGEYGLTHLRSPYLLHNHRVSAPDSFLLVIESESLVDDERPLPSSSRRSRDAGGRWGYARQASPCHAEAEVLDLVKPTETHPVQMPRAARSSVRLESAPGDRCRLSRDIRDSLLLS